MTSDQTTAPPQISATVKSKERGKMAELAQLDSLSDEQRGELDTIESGTCRSGAS